MANHRASTRLPPFPLWLWLVIAWVRAYWRMVVPLVVIGVCLIAAGVSIAVELINPLAMWTVMVGLPVGLVLALWPTMG